MNISYNFFIRINEFGERKPEMVFPPQFNMLAHLGELELSKSLNVYKVINEIKQAQLTNADYSFASDDWCIVNIQKNKATIVNGFDEFNPFEVTIDFILKLMTHWHSFLLKYENGKIPGLIYK